MSISFNNDYSILFNSFSSGNSSASSAMGFYSNLSDYSLIKSGAYKHLMKAYYAQSDTNTSKNSAVSEIAGNKLASKDSSSEIQQLQKTSSALKDSAKVLYSDKGKNKLFEEGNEDKLLSAVSTFVKDYNAMVDAAGKSDNNKVTRAGSNMVSNTAASAKMLSSVGISIGTDNKLTLDEDAFKKADSSTVKTLFSGAASFAYKTASSASMIDMYAQSDARSASGIYGSNGAYDSMLRANSFSSYT